MQSKYVQSMTRSRLEQGWKWAGLRMSLRIQAGTDGAIPVVTFSSFFSDMEEEMRETARKTQLRLQVVRVWPKTNLDLQLHVQCVAFPLPCHDKYVDSVPA